MTNDRPWYCGDCNLYDHYISDNFLGCQDKPLLEWYAYNWKVCKSVCCERNVSVKAMYVRMAKLGTNGPVTCFTKIHISLWLLDQIRWGLHWNVEK